MSNHEPNELSQGEIDPGTWGECYGVQNPNDVGCAHYRAVYDHITEVLKNYDSEQGDDDQEDGEPSSTITAALDQVIECAQIMRAQVDGEQPGAAAKPQAMELIASLASMTAVGECSTVAEFSSTPTAKGVQIAMAYNDPRWITARFKGGCDGCKVEIKAGEQAFFYPNGKKLYCFGCGRERAAEFNAARQEVVGLFE